VLACRAWGDQHRSFKGKKRDVQRPEDRHQAGRPAGLIVALRLLTVRAVQDDFPSAIDAFVTALPAGTLYPGSAAWGLMDAAPR
jgi:hypothetical protein